MFEKGYIRQPATDSPVQTCFETLSSAERPTCYFWCKNPGNKFAEAADANQTMFESLKVFPD